jgi:rubredoxin
MRTYVCGMCGWEYDPQQGFAVFGAKPGTAFEDLPEDFCCPVCGARKKHFLPRDLAGPGQTPGPASQSDG